MSFELEEKKVYEDGGAFYCWKYGPVSDDEEGWGKVFDAVDALDGVADEVDLEIDGAYHNEKEYGDIGWKEPENAKALREMLDALIEDENYSGTILVTIGEEDVIVRFQIISGEDGYIDFFVDGADKEAKVVSTALKKTLG